MARPIGITPTLEGEEAIEFLKKWKKVQLKKIKNIVKDWKKQLRKEEFLLEFNIFNILIQK